MLQGLLACYLHGHTGDGHLQRGGTQFTLIRHPGLLLVQLVPPDGVPVEGIQRVLQSAAARIPITDAGIRETDRQEDQRPSRRLSELLHHLRNIRPPYTSVVILLVRGRRVICKLQ